MQKFLSFASSQLEGFFVFQGQSSAIQGPDEMCLHQSGVIWTLNILTRVGQLSNELVISQNYFYKQNIS